MALYCIGENKIFITKIYECPLYTTLLHVFVYFMYFIYVKSAGIIKYYLLKYILMVFFFKVEEIEGELLFFFWFVQIHYHHMCYIAI